MADDTLIEETNGATADNAATISVKGVTSALGIGWRSITCRSTS